MSVFPFTAPLAQDFSLKNSVREVPQSTQLLLSWAGVHLTPAKFNMILQRAEKQRNASLCRKEAASPHNKISACIHSLIESWFDTWRALLLCTIEKFSSLIMIQRRCNSYWAANCKFSRKHSVQNCKIIIGCVENVQSSVWITCRGTCNKRNVR